MAWYGMALHISIVGGIRCAILWNKMAKHMSNNPQKQHSPKILPRPSNIKIHMSIQTCCPIVYNLLREISSCFPWLVVLTILKNHGVRQWEGWHPIYIYIIYPYMKWNIKFMFETTNQWLLTIINHHYPILNQCSKPPTSSLSFKGTSPSRATSAQALLKNACEILLLLRAIGSVLFGEHRHVPTYGVLENLPWYRWPIEIDGLPIKNGDFP